MGIHLCFCGEISDVKRPVGDNITRSQIMVNVHFPYNISYKHGDIYIYISMDILDMIDYQLWLYHILPS